MSSQNPNGKHKSQKYQNKTAFKLKYHDEQEKIGKQAPKDHLCKRCLEQIEWKIQFGKYKPISDVRRCTRCQQKRINKSYRTICDLCANIHKICAKCAQSKEIFQPLPTKEEIHNQNQKIDHKKLREMEQCMAMLRERSRRMLLRKIKKDLVEWQGGHFVCKESGHPIEGLQFKKDQEDDFMSEEDEEEEEEMSGEQNILQIVNKLKNNNNNKHNKNDNNSNTVNKTEKKCIQREESSYDSESLSDSVESSGKTQIQQNQQMNQEKI